MDLEKAIETARENCVGYFYDSCDELWSFGSQEDKDLISWNAIQCASPISKLTALLNRVPFEYIKRKSHNGDKYDRMLQKMKDKPLFIHVPLNKKRFIASYVESKDLDKWFKSKGKESYSGKEKRAIARECSEKLNARYLNPYFIEHQLFGKDGKRITGPGIQIVGEGEYTSALIGLLKQNEDSLIFTLRELFDTIPGRDEFLYKRVEFFYKGQKIQFLEK